MEGAINSTTNEYVSALRIELDSSYQFPKEELWYADPNEILTYDKEKVKDIKKIEVRFRKGNDEVQNYNGTIYSIAPCFFIPNKTELGINLIPESKEHKLAKNWIYNRIKKQMLIFQYSTATRPFDYVNTINIKDLNIDYSKVGIEVTIKNNKVQRADIIIPFNSFNILFGTGIVIEIQFSKQYEETTEKRNKEWAFKGYSICWLWIDDFKNISEEIIELKEDKLIIEPLGKILYDYQNKIERDIRLNIQELSRNLTDKTDTLLNLIQEKMKELNYPFCIGECKKCHYGYMTKKKGKYGYFYGCSNYPLCKSIIKIEGDNNDSN